MTAEELILEEFYKLCEEILKGEAEQDNIQRLTKAMIDINKQHIITTEFRRIASILKNKLRARLRGE